jgi:hypothetical protein
MLTNIILPSRSGEYCTESGMDSVFWLENSGANQKKIDRFLSFPYKVEYKFNSRGFRDSEWPESLQELQDAVWCVGDSFTVGIGSPFDHTWTQILARRSKKRTINISMDGASNDWIYRRALQIHQEVNPRIMIVMWSYTHRREHPDTTLSDEQRRIHHTESTTDEDLQHWLNLMTKLRTLPGDLIHSTIPRFDPLLESDRKALPDDVIYVDPQLDYARDHHHFDILTSRWFVDQISDRIG